MLKPLFTVSGEGNQASNIDAVSSLGYSWDSWGFDVVTGQVIQASNVIGSIKFDSGNCLGHS